jgi:hypothetical protein
MDRISIPCNRCNAEGSFTIDDANKFNSDNRYMCDRCKSIIINETSIEKNQDKENNEKELETKIKELENKLIRLQNAKQIAMIASPNNLQAQRSPEINNLYSSAYTNSGLITNPNQSDPTSIKQSIKKTSKDIVVIFENGIIQYSNDENWLNEKDWIKLNITKSIVFIINYKTDPIFLYRELKQIKDIGVIISDVYPSITIYDNKYMNNNLYKIMMSEDKRSFLKVFEYDEMKRETAIWDLDLIKKIENKIEIKEKRNWLKWLKDL